MVGQQACQQVLRPGPSGCLYVLLPVMCSGLCAIRARDNSLDTPHRNASRDWNLSSYRRLKPSPPSSLPGPGMLHPHPAPLQIPDRCTHSDHSASGIGISLPQTAPRILGSSPPRIQLHWTMHSTRSLDGRPQHRFVDAGVPKPAVQLGVAREGRGQRPVGECLRRIDIARKGNVVDRAFAVVIVLLEEELHAGRCMRGEVHAW